MKSIQKHPREVVNERNSSNIDIFVYCKKFTNHRVKNSPSTMNHDKFQVLWRILRMLRVINYLIQLSNQLARNDWMMSKNLK
jgi:hypothetical protein